MANNNRKADKLAKPNSAADKLKQARKRNKAMLAEIMAGIKR